MPVEGVAVKPDDGLKLGGVAVEDEAPDVLARNMRNRPSSGTAVGATLFEARNGIFEVSGLDINSIISWTPFEKRWPRKKESSYVRNVVL
jgi:hypothetical protein